MPHLILEYSENIIEKNHLPDLFKQCHLVIAKTLPTKIENCKSRGVACPDYCLGDGKAGQAFVHVSLKIMPGRTDEVLKQAGQQLMAILRDYFKESAKQYDLQLTLEISHLATYFN